MARALVLLLLAAATPGLAESVTATLDRNIISLGEEATLVVSFNGVQPSVQPSPPRLPNVVVGNVSVQRSATFINGQGTTTLQFLYPLRPTRIGQITIPSMTFDIAGNPHSTAALALTVTQASSAPSAGSGQVKLLLPKTSVYLGEILPIEIALYIQAGRNPTSPQLVGEGFTVGSMEQHQLRRAQLGSTIYNLVPFQTFVAAAKSGRLRLGPASITLDVPSPSSRRDILGRIVDWQRVTLTSEMFEIEVKPLPQANVPSSFSGAVGQYTLAVTAGPTTLSVGDPITVRIRLTGRGHLDSLILPPQAAWSSFQTYPPSSSVSSADPQHLSGTKDFEQVLVPLDDQLSVLPPFQFSYFDVEANAYRTLTGPAFPLNVSSAAHTSRDVPALTNQARGQDRPAPEPDDILHIKSKLERHHTRLLLSQGWFLCLQAIPVLTWAGFYLSRRRREALLNNPRLLRQRQVSVRVRQGLNELRAHAQAGAVDQFFATLFRLLQEQLGERLDLPASAITESVIEERLRISGLAEQDLSVLHDLFQACNQARYAPQASSARMDQIVGQTETVLQKLQALKI